jgi:hypothetical protein
MSNTSTFARRRSLMVSNAWTGTLVSLKLDSLKRPRMLLADLLTMVKGKVKDKE